MRIRTIIYALLLLVMSGCAKVAIVEGENGEVSGAETVRIGITTAAADTKTAKDGDIMNNLRIWLVKNGETTVRYYSSTTPKAAAKEVVFQNVERGEYTMYIIANSTANSSYVQGSAINDSFMDVTLPSLSGNQPPFTDADGMPMSLIQEIQVTAGTNYIEAELIRVCGKIRVTVHNRTADKKVFLRDFSFTGKNPSKGYLFFKDHTVPSGTIYGDFTSLNATTGSETIGIAVNEDKVVFEQYLYESGNIELGLDIKGALYPKDFSRTPTLTNVTKSKWEFTGSATNTDIETGSYYVIANASNQRFFLCVNGTNLSAEHGQDNDSAFLASMNAHESDYLKFLWTFSSSHSPVEIKNYGTKRYMTIWYGSSSTSDTGNAINTNLNNNARRFYYDSSYYGYYYLYYDEGLKVDNYNANYANRGWYLKKIIKKSYSEVAFDDEGIDEFSHTASVLKYIDDFGAPVTLNEICRNQILDIHLNVFHSESTGKLYFEVNAWRTPDSGQDKNTTFD